MEDEEVIVIRQMEPSEIPEVKYLAKHSVKGIERLFVQSPLNAIVAVKKNIIVGGAIIKVIDLGNEVVGIIDSLFVVPDYQQKGISKEICQKTIDFLWKNECTVALAVTKDDNAASCKSLSSAGFVRSGLREATKHIGLKSMTKLYLLTPMVFANGMDLFMVKKDVEIKAKTDKSLPNIIMFMVVNLLLLSCVIFRTTESLIWYFYSVFLILYIDIFIGFIATLFTRRKWVFRLSSCGGGLVFLINTIGGLLPMLGNWYPAEYDDTKSLKRSMAFVEILKFLVIAFFAYFTTTLSLIHPMFYYSSIVSSLLILYKSLAFYPFDVFGSRRIVSWCKYVYIPLAIIGIIIFAFTLILWL